MTSVLTDINISRCANGFIVFQRRHTSSRDVNRRWTGKTLVFHDAAELGAWVAKKIENWQPVYENSN